MTDERRTALLAAALATLLAETSDEAPASTSAWSRTGHPHARSWAWNPRSPGLAWRLSGRLAAQNGAWHGRST
ncbi:MAG: hypothetical protein JXB39_14555 [Deltaproteobacteria bacterium]|nr:hypothetical protein [Deltaproteobacteria bacterium]